MNCCETFAWIATLFSELSMKASIYCVSFPGMGLDLGERLAVIKKRLEQFSTLFLLIETQPKEICVD